MPVPVSGPRTMTAPDFMRSSKPSAGFALRTSNSVPVTAMSNPPPSTRHLAYGRQRPGRRVRAGQGGGQDVAEPEAALLESLVLVLHGFTTRRGSSPSA